MFKEKIDAYIDSKKEEMLADLMTLVRIDSQKGEALEGKPFGEGPAAVLAEAERMLAAYGLRTRNYENYVLAGDFSEEEKGLDILAHLDVVPVTQDWTMTQPFEPKIIDGRIYGRGTADDKGPAIAALYAIRAIKELGLPMKKSVRLVLGADEECGSSDLEYYYSIEEEAPYTFTPDADFPVINIEKGRFEAPFTAVFPTDTTTARVLSLVSGDKANVVPGRAVLHLSGVDADAAKAVAKEVMAATGIQFAFSEENDALRVDARGMAAHASTPAEGKNALTGTLRLVKKLSEAGLLEVSEGLGALLSLEELMPYEDTCGRNLGVYREEEHSGAVTMCFSILRYTPESLKGDFDFRLPVGCDDENTRLPIVEAFQKRGIAVAEEALNPPHMVPGDSPFVKTLLGSYERYTGIKGEPLSTGGGTYVHHLERGVAFGCMTPDVDNHMHGDDEFMVIDVLLMSAKIFADAILKICNEL